MRIAVIGAGNVGGTLGRRWATLGHEVVFGVRRPAEGAAAVKGGDENAGGALPAGASVATPADAVRGAAVVVLATPWKAVQDALREAGSDTGALDGLIVVDTTNPVGAGLTLDVGEGGASAAERVQAMVPNARVVKAFNTTGFNNMQDPTYGGAPTVMFHAGDDADAKRIVGELSTALGFDAIDAGALVRARELEHLALLWISLAFGGHGREIGFRLVTR